MADFEFCRTCGEPNAPDAEFCAKCGVAIVSAATPIVLSPQPPPAATKEGERSEEEFSAASPSDTAPSPPQPPTEESISTASNYCNYCGVKLTAQTASSSYRGRCITCAAKLAAAAHSRRTTSSPPPHGANTTLPAVLVILGLIALFLLAIVLFPPIQAPAYEWKTGVNPPQELKDLTKRGTTVLLISQDSCQPVASVNSTFAGLQEQYPNVTFVSLNLDHNTTTFNVGRFFDITHVPTILVIRGDGAAAKFQPYESAEGGTIQGVDISTVKSAIEDAQSWQQTHPTPNT